MDVVIPTSVTDIISDKYNCMIGLKGEESNTEVYLKTCNTSGEITFTNGSLYKGELLYGCMHGKGELIFENGAIYTGYFDSNHMHGIGTLVFANGNEYHGQFENGLRHGKGKFVCPKIGFEYYGDFTQGQMTGKAIITYSDGSTYHGDVVNGKKQGRGKLSYPNSEVYEGDWYMNDKHGFGKMIWEDKEESYQGFWVRNKLYGLGTYLWFKKQRKILTLTNRYVGEFFESMRHGIGTFFYADGSKYEGEFEKNLKHGFGFYTEQDGQVSVNRYYEDRLVESIAQKIEPDTFFHHFAYQDFKNPFDQVDKQFVANEPNQASVNFAGVTNTKVSKLNNLENLQMPQTKAEHMSSPERIHQTDSNSISIRSVTQINPEFKSHSVQIADVSSKTIKTEVQQNPKAHNSSKGNKAKDQKPILSSSTKMKPGNPQNKIEIIKPKQTISGVQTNQKHKSNNVSQPEVTMQHFLSSKDGNQATFYKSKTNDTKRDVGEQGKPTEDVSLVLTENLYKNLPFYRKFDNTDVLFETLFRNHSILRRIYDNFLEENRVFNSTQANLFNPYTLFENSKTDGDLNQSVIPGGLKDSVAPDKRSRRSKTSRNEDGIRMFKTLIYRSKLLQGYSAPVSLNNQISIMKEFNQQAEPIIPKEITRANPQTFEEAVKLAQLAQIPEEDGIFDIGNYPIDLTFENKLTSTNLNPCMKLSEFVLFLKEMRLISTECSLVEVLRLYGELKGNSNFKLQIKMGLLKERLIILKKGLGLDVEKNDIFVKGIRKNSSTPDLSEPAQNTRDVAKNLNRKRTFTEGNVQLSPERHELEFQDESLITSEPNFKKKSPKKKDLKLSKRIIDESKLKSQSLTSQQDLTDDNSRNRRIDGIHESTEDAFANRSFIEKSQVYEPASLDDTLFPNLSLFLEENLISSYTSVDYSSTMLTSIEKEKTQRDFFDFNSPVFFSTFVELLFVTMQLKSRLDGVWSWNNFNKVIKEHIKIMQDHRKTPRELVAGTSGLLEKIRNKSLSHKIVSKIQLIINKLKENTPLPKVGGFEGVGYAEFLKVEDVKVFLQANGIDMNNQDNLHLFIDCLESEMDPDKSYKRFYRRVEKLQGTRKMKKYEQILARELKKKLEMHLFDFQIFELLVLFLSKFKGLHIKDKKYTKKMSEFLISFTVNIKSVDLPLQKRPPRCFPSTKKDIDLQNIKLIKAQKAQREEEKRQYKIRVVEEQGRRKEGIMMKLEDYDILLSDSEEELAETEEYSITESIGGESFYKYTPSAEQLFSKRYIIQKQIAGKQHSKKDNSKNTPTPKPSGHRPALKN